MAIVKNHRQTVLDHDPKTGEIVGATKIFERRVIENDVDQGKLASENEAIELKDVPKLWGATSDRHVDAMAKAETAIAKERDDWAKEREALTGQITQLETALSQRNDQVADLQGRLQVAKQVSETLAKVATL